MWDQYVYGVCVHTNQALFIEIITREIGYYLLEKEEGEEGRKSTIPPSLPLKFRLPHVYFKTLGLSRSILFVYINIQ